MALLYHDVYPGETFDYGRIGRSATDYHIPARVFRDHLELLRTSGLRVLNESEVRTRVSPNDSRVRCEPGVLLSFDDGWAGAVRVGASLLADRAIPAFFFVTTAFLDRPLFARSADIRRLDPRLFSVGSHGLTHRLLSSLPTPEVRRELTESKQRLEALLGRPVNCLSVPGGAVDRRVRVLAEEAGYSLIFTSTVGINPTTQGAAGVARIPVRHATDHLTFARWIAFDLGRERLRAAILQAPKRILGARAYAQLRRVLLGEASDHAHVFQP